MPRHPSVKELSTEELLAIVGGARASFLLNSVRALHLTALFRPLLSADAAASRQYKAAAKAQLKLRADAGSPPNNKTAKAARGRTLGSGNRQKRRSSAEVAKFKEEQAKKKAEKHAQRAAAKEQAKKNKEKKKRDKVWSDALIKAFARILRDIKPQGGATQPAWSRVAERLSKVSKKRSIRFGAAEHTFDARQCCDKYMSVSAEPPSCLRPSHPRLLRTPPLSSPLHSF
jgi:hypothetical protein